MKWFQMQLWNFNQLIYVMCSGTFLLSNNSSHGKNVGWCLVHCLCLTIPTPTTTQKAPVLCPPLQIIRSKFYNSPLRQVGITNPVIHKRKVELRVTQSGTCRAIIQIQVFLTWEPMVFLTHPTLSLVTLWDDLVSVKGFVLWGQIYLGWQTSYPFIFFKNCDTFFRR